MSGYALTPQSLSDSLNAYAARYQRLDPIKVNNIRQKGRQVTIFANPALSGLVLDEQQLLYLRRHISMWVWGDSTGTVKIMTDDHEMGELIPSRLRPRRKADMFIIDHSAQPLIHNRSLPYSISCGLQDRHIALWASHGLYYKQNEQLWHWQRARLWTTVEDLYTSSYTMPFLVPMLENAGAIVIQPRERDTQTNEYIFPLDTIDTDHGFTYLSVPKSGEYGVYISFNSSSHNTRSAVYSVTHGGETTQYEVNQQMYAGKWVYIGKMTFTSDTALNYVHLHKAGNGLLSIGAVRLGGGMGSIEREGQTSGFPRWMEGARYWLEYNGLPDSIYSYTEGENDYLDDLGCRGRWVNHLKVPIDLCLALHSDAGVTNDSSKIGTLVIYSEKNNDKQKTFPSGGSRMVSRDMADLIQTQIVNDIRLTMDTSWSRRALKQASYSEARLPNVPTVLVEMLSHQNLADMQLGLDPKFKFIVSRAIYKGVLRFLHEQDETPFVVQPLPPHCVAIDHYGDDSLHLSWKGRQDSIEPTANPTFYVVYTREEGKDWDNGIVVADNSLSGIYSMKITRGTHYDFRVVAGNTGGVSLFSETASARILWHEAPTALIINGFMDVSAPETFNSDSLSGGIAPGSLAIPYGIDGSYIGAQCDYNRLHEWVNDDECGFGMCHADQAQQMTVGNTFNYPTLYANAMQEKGLSYISRSIDAPLPKLPFDLVVIIMGKHKSRSDYWSPATREWLTAHLRRGGRLLLSGSNIGSGLTSVTERQFAERTLHYKPFTANASATGIVRLSLPYSINTDNGLYTVVNTPNDSIIATESPDGIRPASDAMVVARYTDSQVCAGVAYKKQIIALPFMMESVTQFQSLLKKCLDYLIEK
ncbi:MAG: N-acetylmuramoyl-L-alanine amidase [Paludibacteraceae bacterium]|nr:N-acetylmuramoyl-L-alanine amidase [Paludibacteraceae bacterium]